MTAIKPPDLTPPPIAPVRGDRNTFSDRLDAFIAWLVGFVAQSAALASNVNANAIDAYNSASQANASQAAAAVSQAAAAASAASSLASPSTSATSSTALTIAAALQTLVIQTGKNFAKGMTVKIAMTATPDTWMIGDIISYDPASGQLVVAVSGTQNLGTASAWTVSISAPPSREATEPLQVSLQYLPSGLLAKETEMVAGFPRESSYLYYPNGLVKSKTRKYRGKTRVESFYCGQNLFAYPNDFTNAAWTTIGPLSPFSAVIDGKYATKWTSLNVTSFHYFYQTVAFSKPGAYTASYFVASAGVRYVQLLWSGTVSSNYVNFDLQTGTVCNAGNFELGTIAPVPGGYVISITSNITNITSDNVFICIINSATSSRGEPFIGDGVKGIFISSAQVSFGTKQPYVSNYQFAGRASTGTYFDQNGVLQTAAANMPRWSYDPSDLSRPPALLLEPAATNLYWYSEQLDNAVWIKNVTTVSANILSAPDSTSNADKLCETNTTNYFYVSQPTVNVVAGNLYTVSAFVGGLERNKFWIETSGALASCGIFVDLINKTYVFYAGAAVGKVVIFVLPNGYLRVCLTVPAVASGGANTFFGIGAIDENTRNYAGTAGYGIALWGMQIEPGPCPTSYMPTLNAPATRAADQAISLPYSDNNIAAMAVQEF